MKFSTAALLSACFLQSSVAFTPTPIANRAAPLQSAVLEETATDAATDESPKKKQPTRFDRLKQLYKGPTFRKTDNSVDFSYDEFDLAVQETEYGFERNAIVEGMAVEYAGSGCLVDIGAKSSAYLPEQEAGLMMEERELTEVVPLDTPLQFQIISEEDENGQLLVSIKRLEYKRAWEKVTSMAEADEVLEAPVVAVNRGGAICLVEGLRAFLPGSHLTGQLPDENLIGQTLPLKFLEVTQENNKLVVSNRKAVVEQQMADLSRGDVVQGLVKALKPYGAFVEVGGMSGLLHISQISHDRIEDLEAVLQPGMQIKCMIIDHDKLNGRIALATKTLEYEPGAILKNPDSVFEKAEETAEKYLAKMEEEKQAREAAARDIVLGLGDSLDGLGLDDGDSKAEGDDASADPLQDVSDSLDSLLS
uniref:S1 motif domain-containing protein n=1 Tax=Entomoneis paludosa TaxID=265537 RepID=A0A7S2YAR6_9STRA|mmetsp:Transcript_25062/g.52096  ORF Transcript_25062/g.52096 Transcript_25062/m.52096 type:complete len:420 (+) Transcript_25062:116-1375(+)|eukprot:CAMPEP_0172472284 /NCGR_PEP_ID=MMETSP1065-20121228/68255_1 /TAXON_ID=265537 /ORGANISM="Amphiprora paludosa, Strain CCMP125" /LENGTH=419 /DNA_ID=CAMNT_0013230415 /DNA_START=133 /DNA_END=1392 /DNA_ORIENTATION=+